MNIKIIDKKSIKATDSIGFLVTQDELMPQSLKEFADKQENVIEKIIVRNNFSGKSLETCVIPLLKDDSLTTFILVGLGAQDSKKKMTVERYRRAIALLYRRAMANKAQTLVFELPPASWFGLTEEELAKETAIILTMTSYHFDEFLTDSARKEHIVADIGIMVDAKIEQQVKQGLTVGTLIATGVNRARHWIDLPPVVLTPVELADKAQKVAKENGLSVYVFDEQHINEMGMGGLAGVSRGSEQDCKLVIMEYKTEKKDAPTVALVGKGITFDSGGLSIKPATSMETMKDDMAGAAAVISVMDIIAKLKPDINVIGLTPLSENLPSGKATKPGDIVRFYNGKTAEVKNTDAEGRLILADALSYAVKHYNLDAIIDIATLTGAVSYALGPFFSGLMGNDEHLIEEIKHAAERSGERVWQLPLDDDFKIAIRSDVADLCNSGNAKYRAGTITGALFLQNFVGEVPWVHLDIAGTAFDVPDIPYYRSGATGAGIRLLVDLIMNWRGMMK